MDKPFQSEKKEEQRIEVSSSDIPNAHAAGDGAMGRNDEKLAVEKEEKVQDDKSENSKPASY